MVEVVDSGPETSGGGGLRSLRMKRALVTGVGGGGSSLVGLGEREERLVRSLVGGEDDDDDDAGLERKRRTPFMLMGTGKNDVLAQPTAGYKTALKWRKNEAEAQGNARRRKMSKDIYATFGQAERPATTLSTIRQPQNFYGVYCSTLPRLEAPHRIPSSNAPQTPSPSARTPSQKRNQTRRREPDSQRRRRGQAI